MLASAGAIDDHHWSTVLLHLVLVTTGVRGQVCKERGGQNGQTNRRQQEVKPKASGASVRRLTIDVLANS